jgi:hypothetical protein
MSINRNFFMVTPTVDCDITAGEFAEAPQFAPGCCRSLVNSSFVALNSREYSARAAGSVVLNFLAISIHSRRFFEVHTSPCPFTELRAAFYASTPEVRFGGAAEILPNALNSRLLPHCRQYGSYAAVGIKSRFRSHPWS